MPQNNVDPAKFEDIYHQAKEKLKGDEIEKEKKLASTANNEPKPENYRDIAEFWDKKDLNIAAHYYKKGCFIGKIPKKVSPLPGNLFYASDV